MSTENMELLKTFENELDQESYEEAQQELRYLDAIESELDDEQYYQAEKLS
jgi:hypothetical protein